MINNKWFNDFLYSFAGSVDRHITEKQAAIFRKYAEEEKYTRYTTTWKGTAVNYKFTCQRYKKGQYTVFTVYVQKNNDSIISALEKEYKELDRILDTDISDSEFDEIEEKQILIQKRIAALLNDYSI